MIFREGSKEFSFSRPPHSKKFTPSVINCYFAASVSWIIVFFAVYLSTDLLMKRENSDNLYDVTTHLVDRFGPIGSDSWKEAEFQAWKEYLKQTVHLE